MKVERRIFVVGAPRSGTTLIQRCLSNHPACFTTPETGFFRQLCGSRFWAQLALYGCVRPSRFKRAYRKLSERIGYGEGQNGATARQRHTLRTRRAVERFVELMDQAAIENEKKVWIEKTPTHYRFTSLIREFVPDSHVIHVVRDGRAVLGSLRARAVKWPDYFGHEYDLERALSNWNRAIQASYEQRFVDNVHFVSYEALASWPEEKVRALADSVGIGFDRAMLSNDVTNNIFHTGEGWKSGVKEPIQPSASRYDDLFNKDEKEKIVKGLDWHRYREILERAV